MNDFGKYVHRDSLVHSMNPALKIVYVVEALVLLFTSRSQLDYIMLYTTLIILIVLSKLSLKLFLIDLLKFKWFLLIVFALQLLPFTKTSFTSLLLRALSSLLVVAFTILLTFLVFRTTTNVALARAIEVILRCFGMKKTARKISLLVMLALLQIPILFEQMERIRTAQTLRGQTWKVKNPLQALKALESIIVPLLFFSLRRAESLSVALEMRRYGACANPTLYKTSRFSVADLLLLFLMMLPIAVRFMEW